MSDKQETSPARTPWHLWVVGIIALLWAAVGAFDYLMTQTKNEEYMSRFSPEQLSSFYGLPAWVVSMWAIAVWGAVAGAILLLLRKCVAVWVMLVSLVAMVISTFHNYVLSNGMDVSGDAGSLVFTAVIFVVSLALFLYARAMQKRGVLR